jgi:serine/threonine-protein kinase
MSLTPGARLGAYEVVSTLGAGAMGEVYLAHDRRLARDVAIKVLPPAFVGDPDLLHRFEREARAVAALNHPHILAVFDIGRHEGTPYIVMEHVRGETLAAYLKRQLPPLARAIEIGIEIAGALAAAHRAGLVHRDLKPSNVMLTSDEHVKVLDFGLAKQMSSSEGSTVSRPSGLDDLQTIPGQMLGTPGYMSPEQFLGQPIDHRTDIYSIGVILFQLVTGQRPFEDVGFNPFASALPSVCVLNPQVPTAVGDLIARTMARDPMARPQSAEALKQELTRLHRTVDALSVGAAVGGRAERRAEGGRTERRSGAVNPRAARYAALSIAGALVIAGAAVPIMWRIAPQPATLSEPRPVIAVLPLTNLSGDESKAYVSAGITDSLTTSLGRLSSISVVSQPAVQESQALRSSNLSRVAQDLGATMLVQGSVQQSGERVRVNATLLTREGKIVWTGDSEGTLGDLFSLESRLAGALLDALRVNVSDVERRTLATPPTTRRDALEAYWRGTALRDRADDTIIDRAIGEFQQAVSLDTGFSLAHARLGEAYRRKSVVTNDKEWMTKAAAEVSEALRLDPDQPEVRLALANVYRSTGRNGAAVEELRRTITGQPTNADAHRMLGDILRDEGRFDDALVELQRAVSLRPEYWGNYSSLGVLYLRAGKHRDAIAAFTRMTDLKPDDNAAYQQLGTAYQLAGDTAHARENYERANSLGPNANASLNLGAIYHSEGRYEDAVRAYKEAIRLVPTRPAPYRNLGDAYLKLGRKADAVGAYQQAVRLAEEALALNPTDPMMLARLAVYEAKVGRRQDAERHANGAVTLNPASPEVLYRRAVVLALNGAQSQALQELTEAISKGYSKQQARDDDDLASLKPLPQFQSLVASVN